MRNISYIFIISIFAFSLIGCSRAEKTSLNEKSICVQITESTVITFPDKNLERAIRENIQYPSGDILKDDVDTLTNLKNVKGKNITNLSGIENLTNLVSLDLSNNQITSIQPLKELANLTKLKLANNKIKDYTPITAYYKNLEKTDVVIADITPIEKEIKANNEFAMCTDTIIPKEEPLNEDIQVAESSSITPGQAVVVKDNDHDKAPETPAIIPKQEVVVKDNDKTPEIPVIEPKQEVIVKDNDKAPETPVIAPKQEVVTKDNDNAPESPVIIPKQSVVVNDTDKTTGVQYCH